MMGGSWIKSSRGQWDPSCRFETSWLLPATLLGGLRLTFAIYAFTVLFFVLGWYCTHADLGGCTQAGSEFSYFTVLTYWGIAFYFLVASTHTLTYAFSGRPLLDRFSRPLQELHSLLYTSICVFPIIVTVVYWAILYSGAGFEVRFVAWSNISRHALNAAFALFEIVLPRTEPPPWIHILWLIIILALYLALAYLTRATKGFYVYSFLDPAKSGSGMVGGYVAGIAVGCIVVFLVVWGLIWLRKRATDPSHDMQNALSPPGPNVADPEMGEPAQNASKGDRNF